MCFFACETYSGLNIDGEYELGRKREGERDRLRDPSEVLTVGRHQ